MSSFSLMCWVAFLFIIPVILIVLEFAGVFKNEKCKIIAVILHFSIPIIAGVPCINDSIEYNNRKEEIEYNKKLLEETKLSKPSESYKNYKEPRETINHCHIPYHKERIVEYKEIMVGTNTYINNQEIMKKVIKKSTLYACVNNENVTSHPNYESLKWKGKYTKMDGTLLTVGGYSHRR